MQNAKSDVSERKHTFTGQDIGFPLAEWLNTERKNYGSEKRIARKRAYQRALHLLEDMLVLCRRSSRLTRKEQEDAQVSEGPQVEPFKDKPSKKVPRGRGSLLGAVPTGAVTLDPVVLEGVTYSGVRIPQVDIQSSELLHTRLMGLNKQLSRYFMWPNLTMQIGDRWLVVWNYAPLSEAEAIHQMVRLAELGLIDRIRQCEQCHVWFFARFRHARFDTMKCQQKFFRRNPDFKKKRAIYLRDYYWKKQGGVR